MIRGRHSMALVVVFAVIVFNAFSPSANAAGAEEVTPDIQRLSTLNREVEGLYREGHFSEAIPLAQEALALAEKIFGSGSSGYANGLNNLAGLYQAMGRYDDALPLFRRTLAIEEKALGAEHPNTARGLNNLAGVYKSMGRYDEALPLYRRALQINEKVLGAAHPTTATSLNNLAGLYYAMGRYGEALPLFRRTLQIDENALGAEHPDTASDLSNLAFLYQAMGRYDGALPLYRRALAINEKALGAEHPDTAIGLTNLAGLYQAMGRYDEALPLFQRALQIREKALGAAHPGTATGLNNLGFLYESMGRYDEALPLFRRALQIREKTLGAEHPDTAIVLNNLAGLYQAMGRYDEALPLVRRALQIREKTLGTEHPDTATSLNNLAILYEAMGRYDEALPLYRRALAIDEKALGAEHPATATGLNNLAGVYKSMGRYDEALPLYRRALQIDEKALGAEHPDTADSLNSLAYLYQSMGRDDDALPLYRRAVRIVSVADITDTAKEHGAILQLSVFSANLAAVLVRQAGDQAKDEAIYYYKLSVNTRQRLRAGTRGLDKATRDTFTQTLANPYRELAQLLIERGRIAEAERVLLMLKEADLTDYLRRVGGADANNTASLQWTPDEERFQQALQRIAQSWQEYQVRWQGISERIKRGEIAADGDEAQQLTAQRLQLEQRTDSILKDAQDQFLASSKAANEARLKSFAAARTGLSEKLGEVQRKNVKAPRTAGLVLLPGERGLTLIVTTDLGAVPLAVKVAEGELNRLIGAMRSAIRERRDYREPAKALYGYLIAPAEKQLGAASTVGQFAILPYGTLRDLPFAALINPADDKHLIEHYAVVMLTADGSGNLAGLDVVPSVEWRGAALGASQADPDFGNVGLPGVTREVCGVVHEAASSTTCAKDEGVMAGRRYLDQRFTVDQLQRLMSPSADPEAPNFLHIATHFNAEKSMLLLGDGKLLVKDMERWNPRLGQYDLVTLSACDSGMSSVAAVESLGGMFRKQGAKAVLATLWPVADVGAAPLMVAFYAERSEHQAMTKAQALQQAQLAMLQGKLNPKDSTVDLRHPYFWAPYVLMGNWL